MTGSITWGPAAAGRLSRLNLAVLFGGLPESRQPPLLFRQPRPQLRPVGPGTVAPRLMPRSAVLRFVAEKGQQLLDNPLRALFRDPVTAILEDAAAHVFGYAAP